MRCFWGSISSVFAWAYFPQRRNTTADWVSETAFIAAFVSFSQPLFWCEPACFFWTVRVALRRRIPCFAQEFRSPDSGLLGS